eukprot:12484699-Alexandrium_andersonii.AAC.1
MPLGLRGGIASWLQDTHTTRGRWHQRLIPFGCINAQAMLNTTTQPPSRCLRKCAAAVELLGLLWGGSKERDTRI